MSDMEVSPLNVEQDIVKNFNLHKKWKTVIVDQVKKQVSMIEEPEEWSDILEDWAWFRDPHPWILKTLECLAHNPATSAYLLANYYIFNEKIEDETTSRRKIEKIAQRFRRAFTQLHKAGLIYGETLFPDGETALKNAVTIWITPFAKEKDIDNVKSYYRSMGGNRKKLEKVDKKTAQDISEHNRKVKVLAILDRYRETSNLNDHFKCPKKHYEGFKTPRKVQSHWRKTKYVRKCPECGRELIQISAKEFLLLMQKTLCEQWDIKL